MPSGAKKRKAAKKKKVNNDSSTTNPHQVIAEENDSGELSSPTPQVEVVKREDGSSENKSEGNIEIETVSKSKDSSSSSSDSSDDEPHVVEKKVVVLESAPVESVPAVESLPEKIDPVVDTAKPVDSLLEEVSQVFDGMKNEEKKDLVVEETRVVEEEQTVDESVLKKHEVEKLQPLVEAACSESRDDVSSSTPPKDAVSEVNGAECANEIETSEHTDRQAPPAASVPVAVQNTTSWKCCCGIFELFSGSGR